MSTLKAFDGAVVLSVLCFGIFCLVWVCKKRSKTFAPTNWPVLGMFPGIAQNAHRFHEYATELLRHNGGTIEIKGPWFSNTNFMLLTCDPANINHILSRNFNNYPKGPHFNKIFQILGDGIINTDSHLWELHRKTTMPLMNHANFRASLERNVLHKMESGLFPALDHYVQAGTCFDLQELFQRMGFDISCQQFLDKDPGSLSVESLGGVDHPVRNAIRDGVNAILYRHLLPERCWKLQKWFTGVDREKNLSQSWEAIDEFIYPILSERKDELNKNQKLHEEDSEAASFSMLTSHMEAHGEKSTQFLRDTFLTLIVAGGDTTASALTWFFFLLAKNPLVQSKILGEILELKPNNLVKQERVFKVEECQELVYLHAAFCESLRLFPSVPFNHKIPVEKDVLPSGHVVTPNTKIIIPFYAMGRIEAIWGEDCLEFKPERWISPNGGIKHQPSYKFPAFNAGPRTCIGKEMAFIVVKMVAANIICHYQWHLVEPHRPIVITDSILLEKKHGLKIKVTKRK